MINLANVGDSLTFLIKDDLIFEQLKNDFPSVLADLTTFKSNPNCSCRGRVFKFFGEQLEQNPNILEKYVSNPEVLQQELNRLLDERMANNYSGKVFTIEKTDAAWAQFSATLMNKSFRGINLVERENSIAVYFL
jgi:hypothetical protein